MPTPSDFIPPIKVQLLFLLYLCFRSQSRTAGCPQYVRCVCVCFVSSMRNWFPVECVFIFSSCCRRRRRAKLLMKICDVLCSVRIRSAPVKHCDAAGGYTTASAALSTGFHYGSVQEKQFYWSLLGLCCNTDASQRLCFHRLVDWFEWFLFCFSFSTHHNITPGQMFILSQLHNGIVDFFHWFHLRF